MTANHHDRVFDIITEHYMECVGPIGKFIAEQELTSLNQQHIPWKRKYIDLLNRLSQDLDGSERIIFSEGIRSQVNQELQHAYFK